MKSKINEELAVSLLTQASKLIGTGNRFICSSLNQSVLLSTEYYDRSDIVDESLFTANMLKDWIHVQLNPHRLPSNVMFNIIFETISRYQNNTLEGYCEDFLILDAELFRNRVIIDTRLLWISEMIKVIQAGEFDPHNNTPIEVVSKFIQEKAI